MNSTKSQSQQNQSNFNANSRTKTRDTTHSKSFDRFSGLKQSLPFLRNQIPFSSNNLFLLHRKLGNRAVGRLIQQKTLRIGQPGDKYEQEADRVADAITSQVEGDTLHDTSQGDMVSTMNPSSLLRVPLTIQSQDEEKEEIQQVSEMPMQLQVEEEPAQLMTLLQRQMSDEIEEVGEEEVQTAPLRDTGVISPIFLIQRQTDEVEESVQEEVQLFRKIDNSPNNSFVDLSIQNQTEDGEPLQPLFFLQRLGDDDIEESSSPDLQPASMPTSISPSASFVQRQPDEEEIIQDDLQVSRQIDEEQSDEPGLSAKTYGNQGTSMSANVSQAITSGNPGESLIPSTKHTLESNLGVDLGNVRVHNDTASNQAASALNARAFTHRNHIWLGAGESQSDINLMAHETTHVLQQDGVVRRRTDGQSQSSAPAVASETRTSAPQARASRSESQGSQGASAEPSSSRASASASANTAPVTSPERQGDERQSPEAPAETRSPAQSAEGTATATPPESGGEASSGGSGTDQLLMPEPRSGLNEDEHQRIEGIEERASEATTQTEELPSAQETVGEARDAVEEPEAETQARSEEEVITELDNRPPPSPEIEELCQRIREIIRRRRPPDEESLVEADPEAMAQEAGGELNDSVEQDAERVQGEYDQINEAEPGQPAQQPQEMEEQPASVSTTDPNATAATPDPVTEQDVSLDADAEASQQRMDEAGMNSKPAQLVETGPIAEARESQGELEQMAERDPAEVLAEAMAARAEANQNMAQLQERALQALADSRASTVTQRSTGQRNTVETEEQIRQRVSTQAREIFTRAQQQVNNLLEPLPRTAMERWNSGVGVLSTRFDQRLNRVKAWIDERHSGVGGFFVSIGDYFTGLPDWVTEEYNAAEQDFGDGVTDLIRDISRDVNSVVASAEAIIEDARQQISQLFEGLPDSLQEWASSQQEEFNRQLDELHEQAEQTRNDFNRSIIEQASQTVQQARERIHELRQAAGGLLGRIVDAVNRFLEDPVKFIIEGLLSLVGIQPSAFWALVARIQSVLADIADDPMNFANNLVAALGQGFRQFFDNFLQHMISGFFDWLFSGLGSVGVQIPRDFSLKSLITFCLQLMGITWPRIRQLLAKHIGERNIALIEKAYEIISTLIEQGPEGIFEMIKEQLNPQAILDQIIQTAVEFLIEAVITRVSARILMMMNPAGAIIQAIELIYRILKWIFDNAARIFSLVETIVNGAADLIAGNISGMANAVEGALARLIAPVIDFLAGFLGLGNLPDKIADTIRGFQEMVMRILERVVAFIARQARSLLRSLGIGAEGEGNTEHDEKVKAGLQEAKKLEQKHDKDNDRALTFEEAEKVAVEVKRKFPVFKVFKVVDGGGTWDYDYAASPGKTVKGPAQENEFGPGDKIPDDIAKGKPKNSRSPDKWLNQKNGKIIVHKANDWTYDDNAGHVVRYSNGFPDFRTAGMVNAEVNIANQYRANGAEPKGMEGDRYHDFKKAEKAKGEDKTTGHTWHHHQDKKTMQEVVTKWHRLFTHMGGVSLLTGRGIGEDGNDD